MSSYCVQVLPTIRPFSAACVACCFTFEFSLRHFVERVVCSHVWLIFKLVSDESPNLFTRPLFSGSMEDRKEFTKFKTICVFCGSSSGNKASYQEAALQLAAELVERRIDLVYGGGSVGLMGLVAQAVHHGGCNVTRITSRSLVPDEINGETFGEITAVSDMHQRKAEMSRKADAFIALPGGYGTLEELLEVITWAQLGIHHKPVGLLNVDGYYNSLLTFIDKAVDEGFVSPSARCIIISASTAKELVKELEAYEPEYDEVTSKLVWEDVDRLNYIPEPNCNT